MTRSPGCPRCRMDLIRFTREVRLPRFTLEPGEEHSLPQVCHTADGSLLIGGGYVPPGSFRVIQRDHARATCRACPGDPHPTTSRSSS